VSLIAQATRRRGRGGEGKTFSRGGIHLPEFKEITADKAIEVLPPPKQVFIPLSQHTGAPCKPLVKRGDPVKAGQMIGQSDAFISAPVHASVSGKVNKIAFHAHPLGPRCETVVIDNDGQDDWDDSIDVNAPRGAPDPAKGKEYLEAVKAAGIVGLGGAGFPCHVKLSPPPGKKIDVFLVNGAECEPYLTADYRVMLEWPDEALSGLRATMVILGVKQAIIAIEDNKPKAIEAMRRAVEKEDPAAAALGEVGVVVCKTKYPQGGEKQLISAVLKRTVPSGGLPMDIGVVVQNVATCVAISDAVWRRKPLIERVVTVAGVGVPEPKNLLVRVGTPFRALLDACGYSPAPGSKLIMGGPMMGKAQRDADAPVVKGTSGLVALTPEEVAHRAERACVRCGRCVDACPMGLMPSQLGTLSANDALDGIKRLGIMDCMECGACEYVCPSHRNLVQWIRLGKMKLSKKGS